MRFSLMASSYPVRHLRRLLWGLALVMVCVPLGCAVMQAAQQPDKRDLSVLNSGVHRSEIIAELGAPIVTEALPDGRVQDVYSFRQGYSKPVKVGRVLFHGAADLATGFVWEIAGIPIEMIADGTPIKVVVIYTPDRYVSEVEYLQGGEVAQRSQSQGMARRLKHRAQPSNLALEESQPPVLSTIPNRTPGKILQTGNQTPGEGNSMQANTSEDDPAGHATP